MRDVTSVLILDSRNMETGCSSKRKLAVEAAYSKSWKKTQTFMLSKKMITVAPHCVLRYSTLG